MTTTKMSLVISKLTTLAAFLIVFTLPGVGHAVEAGKFQFVIGDIKVVSASGVERVPVKGEAFNSGETIITGVSGTAQIRMSDGGLVAVRPDTQMKLDQYVFNGREDGSERKLVSLIKGGFRAITGLIGNRNKENYKILTPSATIGIRGTDHEAVVIPPNAAGGFQAGTYDRVYRGATIIETDKGKLIVNPNQVGFTPGKGIAPVLLPKIPEFFETKSRKPDVVKDQQKDSKDDDERDPRKAEVKGSSARSLSTVKGEKDTTLRSPLDTKTDLGTTTLTTPLTDTTIRSSTTILDTSISSPLKTEALIEPITAPTTTLKSTDLLTAPTTTTTTTLKAPTTTTITSPITTTIAPTTTTIAPTTTTISPTTTTILKSPTTTTTTTISR